MSKDRKKELEEFSELFNDLPDRKDDKDRVVYPFEETVIEVSENLKTIEKGFEIEPTKKEKEENTHDVVKEMCKKESIIVEKKEEEVEEIVNSNIDDNNIDFDILPEEKKDTSNKEEEKKEEEEIVNNVIKEEVKEEVKDTNREVKIINGEVQWLLDSPVAMYRKFYERKRELVEVYTGKQLNFIALNDELGNASVNVTDEIFDQEIVRKKMEEVQQYRERVKQISIKCNVQYFLWKRWIEKDMLKGCLSRVEYLKPAIKQEGLVLEHMGDLEYYYSQLEALYNNCYRVEKTLEAASEMLSRKVSICMELKPRDRYDRSNQNSYSKKESSELDDYDEISDGDVAKKSKMKSGVIGWGEDC